MEGMQAYYHAKYICCVNLVILMQLTEQTCFSTVKYLIIHNVSSDQSPVVTNGTNVTLFGVQPGETYSIEITPYLGFVATNGGDLHLTIS